MEFSEAVKERFSKIYGLAGMHSGVQICSWTRKALRGKGVCYKQKFYGADCYCCCQMSPALAWCQENCVFCWRPMEWMKTGIGEDEIDSPEEIISACVQERGRLLTGIGGAEDVDRKSFERSLREFPSHWAISLSGEPTIYPRLGELVKALRAKKVRTIFIVTNGQEPKRLRDLAKEDALPTQLYVSLAAPNEKLFKRINFPVYKDGWQRLNQTLELLPELKCRKVIRLTLIKGINDSQLPKYAALIEKSKTDFLEAKAYMFLGLSRKRLKKENMPSHDDIKKWAKKLEKHLKNYSIIDEDAASRIVLLKRKDSDYPNIIDRC